MLITKLLKGSLAVILVSFIVSFILTIINYTPVVERDPDTYYFSITESMNLGMIYITPTVLVVSTLAFIMYKVIGRVGKIPPLANICVSVLAAAALTSLMIFILGQIGEGETNNIYLIPKGFEGDVLVFYNVKGAPKLTTEGDYDVYDINEQGYFLTSKADMDYGTVTDKYYYVDKEGNRTPISETCVSLFGTMGHSREKGGQQIDLNYSGFKLTKDQCSEEFMTKSFSAEESGRSIINEILKKYYGIDS